MPSLSPVDRADLLGFIGPCPDCAQQIYKGYCRTCDEFYFKCGCKKTDQQIHRGHRTYEEETC